MIATGWAKAENHLHAGSVGVIYAVAAMHQPATVRAVAIAGIVALSLIRTLCHRPISPASFGLALQRQFPTALIGSSRPARPPGGKPAPASS